MVDYTLDLTRLNARFDAMLEKVKHLPAKQAEALYDWQTQDMKRQYPNQSQYDGDVHHWTTTEIHPKVHGGHRPSQRPRGRPKGAKTGSRIPTVSRPKQTGPRPIMRPSLLKECFDRQRALLDDMSWD
jgi:hypothetical protein